MQLQAIVTPAKPATSQRVVYEGQAGNIAVAEGQSYKIETVPNGEEILDVGPASRKRWVIYNKIVIQEFDV